MSQTISFASNAKSFRIEHAELQRLGSYLANRPWAEVQALMAIIDRASRRPLEEPSAEPKTPTVPEVQAQGPNGA